jgi:catechol-2,3-dioxygenase
MHFKALVPILQTDHMAQTRQWYETVLGFQCVRKPVTGGAVSNATT